MQGGCIIQTLSPTLAAAQKAMGDVLYKVVLTKSGETSQTYGCDTTNRILDMKEWVDDWFQTVEVVIDDREGNITSVDLIGYQAVVSYGYNTSIGDEYKGQAPLTVIDQRLDYLLGDEICVLSLAGKGNLMAEEEASAINKKGSATSTSANHLVDTAATFEAGDLGKKVLNTELTNALSNWYAKKVYSPGDGVKPTTENGFYYICTSAGAVTSGSTEPIWPTTNGATIVDGTVEWTCRYPWAKVSAFVSATDLALDVDIMTNGDNYEIHASEHIANSTDTAKTLINAMAGATMPCFSHCAVVTVSWDVEDWLIDSFIPADNFKVIPGQSRLEMIIKTLSDTGLDGRFEADGQLHFFMTFARAWQKDFNYYLGEIVKPIAGGDYIYTCTTEGVSGSVEPTWTLGADDTISDGGVVWTLSYDYQYGLEDDDHNIYQKSTRRRIVSPNKIIVQSYPDMEGSYWGGATEAVSFGRLPNTVTKQMRLASNTEAEDIAKAMLDRVVRDSSTGRGHFPMNVGQEIYDYILLAEED